MISTDCDFPAMQDCVNRILREAFRDQNPEEVTASNFAAPVDIYEDASF